MACLAIATANGIKEVGKIDVKGAFIQTEMKGPPLYIRCEKDLTKLIVKQLPGIAKYVMADGKLYCRLLKDLYGCVQASKLWYEKLPCFLRAQGYESCPTDPCVMCKVINGSVFLLLIYVDDILVLTDKEEAERLQQAFVQEFQWVTMEYRSIHSYLGMQIVLKDGYTIIDMTHFVDKLLLTCEEPLVEYACHEEIVSN